MEAGFGGGAHFVAPVGIYASIPSSVKLVSEPENGKWTSSSSVKSGTTFDWARACMLDLVRGYEIQVFYNTCQVTKSRTLNARRRTDSCTQSNSSSVTSVLYAQSTLQKGAWSWGCLHDKVCAVSWLELWCGCIALLWLAAFLPMIWSVHSSRALHLFSTLPAS